VDQTIETTGTDQAAKSYEKAQHDKNIILGMDAINTSNQYEEKADCRLDNQLCK